MSINQWVSYQINVELGVGNVVMSYQLAAEMKDDKRASQADANSPNPLAMH